MWSCAGHWTREIIPLENYNVKCIYSTHAYHEYWFFSGQFVSIKISYVLSICPTFYSYFTDQITHIIDILYRYMHKDVDYSINFNYEK